MAYQGSIFSPISRDDPSATAEMKRRQQANAQIDFLNQLSQLNPSNTAMQKALLEQYMGLITPQASDPENDLGIAMDIFSAGQQTGDEELIKAGRSMLQENPLLKSYFGTEMEAEETPVITEADVFKKFWEEKAGEELPAKDSLKAYTRAAESQKKAQRLAGLSPEEIQQYQSPITAGERFGQYKTGVQDIPFWQRLLGPVGSISGMARGVATTPIRESRVGL